MLEKTIVVGAFQCNCRLIACPRTGEAILVDPGDEPQKILSQLQGARTTQGVPVQIRYLLHTHGHLDHIGGTRGVREGLVNRTENSAPQGLPKIAIHREDEPLYNSH